MKHRKYHTDKGSSTGAIRQGYVRQGSSIGAVPKSERRIIERDKSNAPYIQIHDHRLSSLGTGTSI